MGTEGRGKRWCKHLYYDIHEKSWCIFSYHVIVSDKLHCLVSSLSSSAYRQVLDGKYGLKRWQIGEIASKIGQLYYHY